MNKLPLLILCLLLPLTPHAEDWPTDMLARLDAEQRVSEVAFSKSDFKALLQSQHRLTAIRRQANDHKRIDALTPLAQTAYYQRLELWDEYAIKWLSIASYAMEAASVQIDRTELKLIQEEQLSVLRDIDHLLNR